MKNINPLNMNITVEKVDGSFEPYDIKKIRNEIAAACEGKNVDPLELESTFHSALPEKVTASYIQEQLMISALDLCSVDYPDWKYVAGRLRVNLLHHQVVKGRGFGYGDFYRTVHHYVHAKQWQAQILVEYSKEELQEAGSWIVKERDNDFDHAGIHTLIDKTLRNFELPQEVFLITALLLALPEEKNNRLSFAKDLYEVVSLRKLSLATPLLSNSRKPKGAAASCYIIQPEDSLESIFHEITNAAKISKNGGGVGVDLSNIRAAGAEIAGRLNSSNGVIPWTVLFNYTGVAVDQGGTRAGAITVALATWHYDFMEFLDIQTEHGEQRKKAYDIFLQAVVSNLFMQRVKANLDWYLVDPHEVKKVVGVDLANLWGEEFTKAYAKVEEAIQNNKISIFKKLKAKYIFKEILKRYVETGMPYLAFKDHINAANPNKKLGTIPCTNLCCESYSTVVPYLYSHVCQLASLNLANLTYDELQKVCALGVRALDNGLTISSVPFEEGANHVAAFRTVGLGALGLADWLALRKLRYTDLDEIEKLFEHIAYYSALESIQLAKERSPFDTYYQSEWAEGILFGRRDKDWFVNNETFVPKEDWYKVFELVAEYGIRNSILNCIAPNTSTSLVQGATASVLPVFSRFFVDKGKAALIQAPPYLDTRRWFYQENKHLRQEVIVDAVAVMQKWIDTGISMELVFNLNEYAYGDEEALTAKGIYDVIMRAWEKECKAIYYIRTIRKDIESGVKSECSSCAN